MSQTDKPKFQAEVIPFKRVRASFVKIDKAEARKGRDGKPRANAKPEFSLEAIFDPTNREHAATILKIKQESVRALNTIFGEGRFTVEMLDAFDAGKQVFQNFYLPWGYGNNLPVREKKIYDGYKDMFFLRLKRYEEDGRPIILNRDGKPVQKGDPQYPYGGAVIGGTTTLFPYNNESRGVGANLRTIVFIDNGPAFGGGQIDANQEFAALGDLGGPVTGGAGGGNGSAASLADPFAI
jgi:hypothetical protein